MANIGSLAIAKGEVLTSTHILSISRANSGYYVLSGCDVNQAGTPGMSVVVDSGYVQLGWGTARKSVAGNTVTITAAHATLPRLDVIYIDSSGIARVYDGTATAISPTGKTDFKQMATPAPGSSIPTGVVIALVYIDAAETTILNADISDIATYGSLITEAPTSTTSGKIPYWSGTAKTLSDGYTVGTTANCLLQLDASARIPAVSGALLTNTATTGVLTTEGDTLCRDASGLARIAKGSSGQSFIQGASIPAWVTRRFDVAYSFGDGYSVLLPSSSSYRIPINSKIISCRIRSQDYAGTLLSGSITCTLYSHDIDAVIGSAIDTFTISSDTDYTETGLSITVESGKWVTIATSSITTMKQITCTLEFEPT